MNVNVTCLNDLIHISIGDETFTLDRCEGFRYKEEKLLFRDQEIICSKKTYEKLVRKYHKHIKPGIAKKWLWFLGSLLTIAFLIFALLLLGLSQTDVPASVDGSLPQNTAVTPQTAPVDTNTPSLLNKTEPVTSEPFFPFGNK